MPQRSGVSFVQRLEGTEGVSKLWGYLRKEFSRWRNGKYREFEIVKVLGMFKKQ